MSTETELKYSVASFEAGQKILESDFLKKYEIPEGKDTLKMKAIYFDDASRTLASHGIGYRIRKENEQYVATIKWGSEKEENGLSKRFEYNLQVDSEEPTLEAFKESIADKKINELLQSIELVPMFITEFTREVLLIEYKNSVIELAFDFGKIIGKSNSTLPICELELELKSGEEEALKELGERACLYFSLTPLNDSKLKRGLTLI